MPRNRVKTFILLLLWLSTFAVVLGLSSAPESIGLSNTVGIFKSGAGDFVQASAALRKAVSLLDARDSASVGNARLALKNSRLAYKRISFFLDYFFESESLIYNRPAKVEVEEPYIEYQEPSGFQVMEVALFAPDVLDHKAELVAQADLLYSSASDVQSLLYGFKGSDSGVMESIRLELVRVIALSITGYDAPELKSGITESWVSLATVKDVLQPYLHTSAAGAAALGKTLTETIAYLQTHQDFDSFNRMEFLTRFALPLQEQLGNFIRAAHLEINERSALNYGARNLFSNDALLARNFNPSYSSRAGLVNLGKKLFQEKALSGNLQRSCETCHKPEQFFTDGLRTSLALDNKTYVQRNAPTLMYAAFQYAQFWDGRAGKLQEQIGQVIANPLEMNGNHQGVIANLRKSRAYQRDFQAAFPGVHGQLITMDRLSDALAAYICTLNPKNSNFDRYMAGDQKAMRASELKGFNLFMGKAQCGSCHFAPLFNGLIPPFYKRTEFEILGTPANDDFDHLKPDPDKGRADFFPIAYYQRAFKTPTVRNVAKTAPYMHNGVFKDLEKVVQFYNQGGGAGLHLDLPQQTLSAKPLHLSDEEVKEIVNFMQSLTDHQP